jgi:hypothetical protein
MMPGRWSEKISHCLSSPANLTGLGLASLALAARLIGWVDSLWLLIVAGSYGLGWQIGRLAFTRQQTLSENPSVQIEAERSDIQDSLNQVLAAVSQNQDGRFDYVLKRTIVELCAQIKTLMVRMETSSAFISTEEIDHVKQIALDYLPRLIESFMAIPGDFAAKNVLAEGKTARELLKEHLAVLQRQTAQMTDDLATRDAASFLKHARFLQQQFGQESRLLEPPLPPNPEL